MKHKIGLLVLTAVILAFFLSRGAESGNGYAGVDACKGCHNEYYEGFTKSVHGKKAVAGSPASAQACESCHGSGSGHVEKGGGKGSGLFAFTSKDGAKEKNAKCLECHENGRLLVFWSVGAHKKNDVACTDCHSIHKNNMHAKEYETCTKCHKDTRAEINKRSHHPIIEGKLKCSSCHNPHGTLSKGMVKADSVNELCYTCHADKRGPFLWEHPPVEENCLSCHKPHGSIHAKLHIEKMPNLCQACHDWQRHPGTRYGSESEFTGSATSNRFIARSCENCHNSIHGSNAPVNPKNTYNSGKTFVR